MTFTIEIEPRSPFGTDKDERRADAEARALEIAQLDGVEKTDCFETVQKASVFENPVVVAALVAGSAQIVVAFIDNLFRLLRKKREKGKYEAFALHIHNNWFHLADDTEASVKAQIEKMIEEADQKKEKK